ncbi:hypothetical protein [Kitasatospora sp. NPDC051164]|uniref:hypothetical protein n=1 Tax=Kitasatospora sp. NPDC051164 TaxID=3364055 RepID=UPI0037B68D03
MRGCLELVEGERGDVAARVGEVRGDIPVRTEEGPAICCAFIVGEGHESLCDAEFGARDAESHADPLQSAGEGDH